MASLGGENNKIRLENLVGCENWAMLLSRETAALKVYKRKMSDDSDHRKELQHRVDDIKQRLNAGMVRDGSSYMELADGKRTPSSAHEATIAVVSMIFALSALIYLQVTIYGCAPDGTDTVNKLLFRVMLNVRFLPDAQLLPNLAWPICIAGCMATTPSQEQFFKDLLAWPNVQGRGYETLRQALEVMEICWEQRVLRARSRLGGTGRGL